MFAVVRDRVEVKGPLGSTTFERGELLVEVGDRWSAAMAAEGGGIYAGSTTWNLPENSIIRYRTLRGALRQQRFIHTGV